MSPPVLAVIGTDGRLERTAGGFSSRDDARALLDAPSPELESVLHGEATSATLTVGGVTAAVEAVVDKSGARHALLTIKDSADEAGQPPSPNPLLDEDLDGSPAIVFLKDLDGRYLRVNAKHTELIGSGEGELAGHTDAELNPRLTVDGPRLARDGHVPQALQIEYVVLAFEKRPAMSVCRFPIHDASGEAVAVCTVALPVSQAMKARDEAERLMDVERLARLDPIEAREHLLTQWGLAKGEAAVAAGETDGHGDLEAGGSDEGRQRLEMMIAEERARAQELERALLEMQSQLASAESDIAAEALEEAKLRAEQHRVELEQALAEAEHLRSEAELVEAEIEQAQTAAKREHEDADMARAAANGARSEAAQALLKIEQLEAESFQLTNRVEQAEAGASQTRSRAEKAESDAIQARARAEQAEADARESRGRVQVLETEARAARVRAEEAEGAVRQARSRVEQSEDEVRRIRSRVEELQGDLARAKADGEEAERSARDWRARAEQAEADLRVARQKHDQSSASGETQALTAELAAERARTDELRRVLAESEQRLTALGGEVSNLRHEADRHEQAVGEERARREAEEQARQEAEERLRQETEERVRLEAEAAALREAGEVSRVDTESTALREAQERARQAEELAGKEAEERARLEAEAALLREAEETARLEVEEAVARADDTARRAQELARDAAEQRERVETEVAARCEAEVAARVAEEAAVEARELAQKEVQERERVEAELRKAQEAALEAAEALRKAEEASDENSFAGVGWGPAAQRELAGAIGDASDVRSGLTNAANVLGRCGGWDLVAVWTPDTHGVLRCTALWWQDTMKSLADTTLRSSQPMGTSAMARALYAREPMWLHMSEEDGKNSDERGSVLLSGGIHTSVWLPIRNGVARIGLLELLSKGEHERNDNTIAALEAVALQLGQFTEMTRSRIRM